MWRDEAYSYFDIVQPTLAGLLAHIRASETNPPLFFFIEHLWGATFGYGEFALKLFPISCGVAAVPAAYLLARRVSGPKSAMLAAAFVAVGEQSIYYSQELRPYAFAALLATFSALAHVRWIERRRGIAPWLVCAIALAYAHYAGLVFLAALGAATLLLPASRRPTLRSLALAYAVLALSYVPWFPFLAAQLRAGTPWVNFLPYAARPQLALSLLEATLPLSLGYGWQAFVAGWFVLVALLGYALHLRRRAPASDADGAVFTLVLGVLAVLAFEGMTGYGAPRYAQIVVPAAQVIYARLLAAAASAVVSRVRGSGSLESILLCGAAFVAALSSVHPTVSLSRSPKTGMREAGRLLNSPQFAKAVILVAPDYAASSAAFYVRRTVHGFPRWDGPEFFDIAGDTAAWGDTYAVAHTLGEVARLRASGVTELALLRPQRMLSPFVHSGTLPYEWANELTEALRDRYTVVASYDLPANEEWVSLIVYDLRSNPAP